MPSVVAIVPVKPPDHGKSRLVGMSEERRIAIATAVALDTMTAALSTPSVEHVLTVTDDAGFAARCAQLGCAVLPDGASDLNESLRQAAAEAARRWPGLHQVVLCADLPALRPEVLESVLASLPDVPAFVPDAAGSGTTLYSAPAGQMAPAFGPDSAEAHRAGGAVPMTDQPGLPDLAPLRRDVDEPADLAAVLALGVGPYTAAALTT